MVAAVPSRSIRGETARKPAARNPARGVMRSRPRRKTRSAVRAAAATDQRRKAAGVGPRTPAEALVSQKRRGGFSSHGWPPKVGTRRRPERSISIAATE